MSLPQRKSLASVGPKTTPSAKKAKQNPLKLKVIVSNNPKPEEIIALPDLSSLDQLIANSSNVAKNTSLTENEIDELIKKREKAVKFLETFETREQQLGAKIKNFNPLKDLKPEDYKRLTEEEIIDKSYADRLQQVAKIIKDLKDLDYPTKESIDTLTTLSSTQKDCRAVIEGKIEEKQRKIEKRKDKTKENLLGHYKNMAEEWNKILLEIDANPRVAERLVKIAEQKRKNFEAQIAKEKKEVLEQANRFIQSISARHTSCLKKLGNVINNENIAEDLSNASKEIEWQKRQTVMENTRRILTKSIMESEGGNQLNDAKEIVPWKVTSSVNYISAVNYLRFATSGLLKEMAEKDGDESAKQTLLKAKEIMDQNEMFRQLIGKEFLDKNNKKLLGWLWAAIEKRKQNDSMGITDVLKKRREEEAQKIEERKKKKEIFEKATSDLVARGGFRIRVPVYDTMRGKRVFIRDEDGAVLLQKMRTKEGSEYWKVAEILGETANKFLKVGSASPLDMKSFPEWLRKSAI